MEDILLAQTQSFIEKYGFVPENLKGLETGRLKQGTSNKNSNVLSVRQGFVNYDALNATPFGFGKADTPVNFNAKQINCVWVVAG